MGNDALWQGRVKDRAIKPDKKITPAMKHKGNPSDWGANVS
jgi:hypothetical protein